MPILNNNNKILSNRDNSNEWKRPSDWLPMPTGITDTDQTFVGLHAVIEDGDNYCAFRFTTNTGQYQVDWGDGTIDLVNSNTNAEHQYDFTNSALDGTLTSRGYKQAIITVTPVSGNLLTCNFQQRYVTSPAQNQPYSTGFLDCILSMPNANTGLSTIFGGTTVRHSYVERVDIKTIGNATSLGTFNFGMFQQCFSLKKIILPNTSNITSIGRMFQQCRNLETIPLFDTSNVTDATEAFAFCNSIKELPLFDFSNLIGAAGMFRACISLKTIPLFNMSNVESFFRTFRDCQSLQLIPFINTGASTSIREMFYGCISLQTIPLLNTNNVINMDAMFTVCMELNSIPALSTSSITTTSGTDFGASFASGCVSLNRCQMIFARTVSFLNCQLSKDALVEIFTNLVDRSSTTSATITITGNWGASALTQTDRDIALNKNWTITG
jgi:surface protein